MKTIKQLKEAKTFTVEEWMSVFRIRGVTDKESGEKTKEYKFEYDNEKNKLFVLGHVFGDEKVEILRAENSLFNLAQEEHIVEVKLKTVTDISFSIYNPRIRF